MEKLLDSWVIVSFADPNVCNMKQLEAFSELLRKIAASKGMHMPPPDLILVKNPGNDSSIREDPNVFEDLQQKFKTDLVIAVLPRNNRCLYGEVKAIVDTLGLASQCVMADTVLHRCGTSTVSNLCLKINAKLGGVVRPALSPEATRLLRGKTVVAPVVSSPITVVSPIVIVVGVAVSHPSLNYHNFIGLSVAAVVGSLDWSVSRYTAALRTQGGTRANRMTSEEILDMRSATLELLRSFAKNSRGAKPGRIVVYRSGVGDQTARREVASRRAACEGFERGYKPPITFVVVRRRPKTRFMPENAEEGAGQAGNVPPGSAVSRSILNSMNSDFFLCSHLSKTGTSRPCWYAVIHDDAGTALEDVQQLTYHLCHVYAPCEGSVSYPAPLRYARSAARRGLLNLQETGRAHAPPGLKDTMYFV